MRTIAIVLGCLIVGGSVGSYLQRMHDASRVEAAVTTACDIQRKIDRDTFIQVEQKVADRCQREINKLGDTCNSLLHQSQQSITIESQDYGSWNPCHMGQVGCP